MYSRIFSLLVLLASHQILSSQSELNLHSSLKFEEMYVSILEIRDTLTRYSPNVETLDVLQEEEWEVIYFPNRSIEEGFPGIYYERFAMIIHSEFTVDEAGVYKFTLSSDDGSVIWIDDQEVVNNDGIHKMTTKENTIFLDSGDHHMKLFYFQLWPDKLGLILETAFLGKKEVVASLPGSLNIHFDSNVSELNEELKKNIDTWIKALDKQSAIHLKIIGHTDNIGSETKNKQLGMHRANATRKYIEENYANLNLSFSTASRGYTQPITSNEDGKGRSQNRRVEIVASK
jgi:hypothetical protein